MKLKVGDRIKVHGWVMLRGLEAGRIYEVTGADGHYSFKTKGRRKQIGHHFYDVDMCINQVNNNHIEILNQSLFDQPDY